MCLENGKSTINFGTVGLATVAGVSISAVDNFALGGEIIFIAIVIVLLFATLGIGLSSRMRPWAGWNSRLDLLPASHVIKRVLRLPDSLQPNTYLSIAMLAGFSLLVCLLGFAIGRGIRATVFQSPSR